MQKHSLFDFAPRSDRASDSKIAKKSKQRTIATSRRGGNSLLDKVRNIIEVVNTNLSQYSNETLIIRDEATLHQYVSKCLDNGVVAIDTETSGLNPITDKLAGVCLYTPNEKTTYIPFGHINYITLEAEANQLDKETLARELARLADCREIVEHNAKFDTRVLRHSLGINLVCTWDTYLASMLMDENEDSHALKPLHQKYVLNGVGDAFKYDDLFKGIDFRYVPIKPASLYAAHDPKITWELKEWQKKSLYWDCTCDLEDRDGMNGVAWTFFNIEMPCVQVLADLEDVGMKFDFEYNEKLQTMYHARMDDAKDELYDMLKPYDAQIARNTHLDARVNLDSPQQLSILLFDVMKLQAPIDKRTKQPIRSTGVEVLSQIDHPFVKKLLEYRGFVKLVSTYIDKMPECVLDDGRVHCNFNQYGAATGRMSSSDPNMQNLPAHAKDIRQMFIATSDIYEITQKDNYFLLFRWDDVETKDGWKCANNLHIGDVIITDEGNVAVSSVEIVGNDCKIYHDMIKYPM